MRELFVVNEDSTDTSLVLRTEDGEEFFLALDDDVRALFGDAEQRDESPADTVAEPDTETQGDSASDAPRLAAVSAAPSRPLSDAMTMRPAEIQNRIRAGATAAELAEDMGVAESRVEPFAHPVLLERSRMAEMAKQAHPVREDGPAKLTLWEILATAFAARGHSLSEATWDAYRNQGEPWVIRITWTTGLTENEAEWTLKQSMTSSATVEARNSVAADLTDPDFIQPVRSLTSVGRGSRYNEALLPTDPTEPSDPADHALDEQYAAGLDDQPGLDDEPTRDDIPQVTDEHVAAGQDASDEDFFQNPDPEPKPTKRRRKATTPHWEDVLLGVRANTKRPRN